MILYNVFNLSIILINKATHDGKHSVSGGVVRSKKMKIDFAKFQEYLKKEFDALQKEIEQTSRFEYEKRQDILSKQIMLKQIEIDAIRFAE